MKRNILFIFLSFTTTSWSMEKKSINVSTIIRSNQYRSYLERNDFSDCENLMALNNNIKENMKTLCKQFKILKNSINEHDYCDCLDKISLDISGAIASTHLTSLDAYDISYKIQSIQNTKDKKNDYLIEKVEQEGAQIETSVKELWNNFTKTKWSLIYVIKQLDLLLKKWYNGKKVTGRITKFKREIDLQKKEVDSFYNNFSEFVIKLSVLDSLNSYRNSKINHNYLWPTYP